MSELQNNTPAPKKRSGLAWFFGGIGLVILLCLLLCCGGVVGVGGFVWQQYSDTKQNIVNATTTTPVRYSKTRMPQEAIDDTFNRCVDAMELARQGKPATLTLTDVELNNLHEERVAKNTAELPGMDINARPGGLKGQISFPNPLDETGMTYLTFDIDLNLEIKDHVLTYRLVSMKDLKGQEATLSLHAIGEELLNTGLIYGDKTHKETHSGTASQPLPSSVMYAFKNLHFTAGKIDLELDPARVKEHNRAMGKPEDSPLFEDN